jgi:tetratricopeptide (TPR) repeat protein
LNLAPNSSGKWGLVARLTLFAILTSLLGCAGFWRDGFSVVFGNEQHATGPDQAEAYAHFLASVIHERHGEYKQAAAELVKATQNAPDSPTLTLRLIRNRLKIEDYSGALASAKRAVEQIPGNANLWIVLGEIQHQLNQNDESVESFKQAIQLDPDNVMGLGGLVSVEESSNDFVAAADIYKKLAEKLPNSASVQFQLGLSLARINANDEARAALSRALELRPELARANYMLGVMDMDAGANEDAVKHLSIYVQSSPDDARARENLAGALGRLGRFEEAIPILAPVLEGEETETRHFIEASYLLLRAGHCAKAEETLPAEGAPAFGSILRALARKASGEPARPILETLDSISTDIDDECKQYLNEILFLFGKAQAGEYFISALSEERNAGVRSKCLDIVLSKTYIGLERKEEAEKILLEALDRCGSDKSLHYCLAILYEDSKRISDAEKHLKECLVLDPDNPEILNFLGYMYADNNIKLDEAKALLEKALKSDPESPYYLDSLGWIYYRKGNADRAIELIEKSIQLMDQDDAELRDHLGDAFLLKGDKEKAVAEWKRAIRLNPKLEGLKEKLERCEKTAP